MLGNQSHFYQSFEYSISFIRDDVEWSEEQNEQANAIIEKQYEQRMSDTKWGLLRR